jgi:hypothetical protein
MAEQSEELPHPPRERRPRGFGANIASPRAILRSSGSWLLQRWQEILLWLTLLFFFLWVRFWTLESIELGGDAIQKWFFVRRWAYASPFEGTFWNHHLARMGDNVPVFLIQRLFGTAPPVYYVGPTLAFLVTAFCTYAAGKRLDGRFTGVLAAAGITWFGPMRRAASQMIPSMFSSMYVMLGTYCLIRYTCAEASSRRRWLTAMAVCFFAAYTSHELTLFFMPGVLLIQWLYGRSWRELALVLGVLFGLFLIETAFYATFTEHASRLHIMMSTHGSGGGSPIASFWGLFKRYASADFSSDFRRYFSFWPFAAAGIALLGRERLPKLIALLPASFLFLTTFLVRGIDPIRVWTSFQSRYLVPAVPLMTLSIALFSVCLARLVWSWLGRGLSRAGADTVAGAWWRRPFVAEPESAPSAPLFSRRGLGKLVRSDVLWAIVLLTTSAIRYNPAGGVRAALMRHPLVTSLRTEAVITDAYERHLPIVGSKKTVALAYYVYIADRALLEGGRLPPLSDKVAPGDRGNLWLSVNPAGYAADARNKRRGKAGGKACVLKLQRSQRFMRPVRETPLPAHCLAYASATQP